ncbi:MAG: capsule biosynthesis protein [Roseomonas sp.]|nr:capsule biosynthesis protein [Roseomonas sp.]
MLSEPSGRPLSLPEDPEPVPRPWYARFWQRPFFLLVILPSLIATFYFYAIAAPQYVSEARFVVSSRGSDGGAQAAMRGMAAASAFGGLGGGMASSETNSVRDFLTSLDAVMDAHGKLDLVALWQRPEADLLAQLWYSEPELLTQFYNKMVTVSLDPATNVTTLRIRSFRPEDSKALAETLLASAEALVNRLSERSRNETLRVARQEMELAEQRVQESRAALTRFREQERELDSAGAVQAAVTLRGQLETALAQARAELTERLKFMRPDNLALQATRNRIEALERQIAAERTRHTETSAGGEGAVLARQLAAYERLMLEREFADKQFASATASLETARLEAQRQQLFLSRIVEPNLPVYPLYPRKLVSIASIFVGLAIAYGIGWLLIVGMREHAA